MAEHQKLQRREFSPRLMNRNWDLSNDAYRELMEQQRRLERAVLAGKLSTNRYRIFAMLFGVRGSDPPKPKE